jgi:acyl carrier protein
MNRLSIEEQVTQFLRSLTGHESLNVDTDLFEAGVTDSLTMMDLLVFIETKFRLRLAFADLNPDVFRTPGTIAALIAERLQEAHSQAA